MNEKFLEVMNHEGPATIITINGNPASVVSTWMSYIQIDQENELLYIPAAGMHSIENDFSSDNTVLVTTGTKEVEGTNGPGAGFYISGKGTFLEDGEEYLKMKKAFPWIRKVLKVNIDTVEQKI
ncbi:pyridoxamine 5'-phosphate oxidase family protein [Paucilactobacillus nenjiangensis]|jgi:hypothetical protein|uniref:pyridoxamine 5'-phosphate oxidase family protein n=1 Tax=Paucilactobacillus nenjiangensis TaxID=1296540 RepID=UPI0010F9A989|nr:pyridoxamine 5'-phosphate oxidase family protein [Paucilactobacillus nenjiangensis]